MNVYVVRYDDNENKSVTFHTNYKDAHKRRTEQKNMFKLGNKNLDQVAIKKVEIGRNKIDFLELFNDYGISTLVGGIEE